MVFSSPSFLFLFLPVFLALYALVPARLRSAWIMLGSWIFYGFWRADFLLLLIGVTFGDWLAGLAIARERRAVTGRERAIVVVTVALNLAVLAYFKYFNFCADGLNAVLGVLGLPAFRAWPVILPVGISFYIFQSMSYVIDVYRGDAPEAHDFVDMAAYVALFPQLVAGPILRYKDLAGQLRFRTHSESRAAYGFKRFLAGLCRKVLVADALGPVANATFSMASPGAAEAWLGLLAYAVQLYFDFSAYSDMAVGLGHMMGFTFMENFDAPYRSRSITDFWRRWHISLSSWLRDYLYLPLGGNRRGRARTYLNLFLVMALGGLWHGASWNFALWGCWHGLLLALERLAGKRAARSGFLAAPAWLFTQLAVLAGWVLFRSIDLQGAFSFFRALAGSGGLSAVGSTTWLAGPLELTVLALSLVVMALEPRAKARAAEGEAAESGRAPSWASMLAWSGLGLLALARLAADSYSPFLYFQF